MRYVILFFISYITGIISVLAYVHFKGIRRPLPAQIDMIRHENENIKEKLCELKKKAELIKNDKTIYSTDVIINDIKNLL